MPLRFSFYFITVYHWVLVLLSSTKTVEFSLTKVFVLVSRRFDCHRFGSFKKDVAVMVCRRSGLSPFQPVAVLTHPPIKHTQNESRVQWRVSTHCLWRRQKADPNSSASRDQYSEAESWCLLLGLVRNYEIWNENDVIESNNLGKFYRFINGWLANKRGIISILKDENGMHVIAVVERAELLNNYFCSVCTLYDDNNNYNFPTDHCKWRSVEGFRVPV